MNSRTKTAENPNNCATCHHKRESQGGWCYMFRDEPTDACMQHTAYQHIPVADVAGLVSRLLRK